MIWLFQNDECIKKLSKMLASRSLCMALFGSYQVIFFCLTVQLRLIVVKCSKVFFIRSAFTLTWWNRFEPFAKVGLRLDHFQIVNRYGGKNFSGVFCESQTAFLWANVENCFFSALTIYHIDIERWGQFFTSLCMVNDNSAPFTVSLCGTNKWSSNCESTIQSVKIQIHFILT